MLGEVDCLKHFFFGRNLLKKQTNLKVGHHRLMSETAEPFYPMKVFCIRFIFHYALSYELIINEV